MLFKFLSNYSALNLAFLEFHLLKAIHTAKNKTKNRNKTKQKSWLLQYYPNSYNNKASTMAIHIKD